MKFKLDYSPFYKDGSESIYDPYTDSWVIKDPREYVYNDTVTHTTGQLLSSSSTLTIDWKRYIK